MKHRRERRLTLGGQRIAIKTWGDPKNPPILAMHGWLDNLASFEFLSPLLTERYCVVAIDLPGHGLSGPLPTGYLSLLDTVGMLIELLDALSWETTVILGHSLGAAIGCLVAGAFPERVSHLCLIDALGPYTLNASHMASHTRKVILDYQKLAFKKAPVYKSIDEAVNARARATPISTAGIRALVARGLKAQEETYTWRTDRRLTIPPLNMLSEEQLESFLKAITAPACLIRPNEGWPFGEALFESRSACFQHLLVHRIPGHHHIHLDEPAQVAQLFLDFLASRKHHV